MGKHHSNAKHHYTPSYPHASSSHARRHRTHVSHWGERQPGLLDSLWDFLFGARAPFGEAVPELARPPVDPGARTLSGLAPVEDPRLTAFRGMHRAPMQNVDWRIYLDAPDPGGEHTRRWAELRDVAARVLSRDTLAYREALGLCGCLVEVHHHVGRDGIQVALSEERGHVDVRAPLGTAIADVVQTPSDRLDVYQDYVCGLALRVARELLAVLPIDEVTVDVWNVTAAPPAPGDAPGAYRVAPTAPAHVRIASVRCARAWMDPVPWAITDASHVVQSLPHQMQFRPGEGFYAVPHVRSGLTR